MPESIEQTRKGVMTGRAAGRIAVALCVAAGLVLVIANRDRLDMDALATWVAGFGMMAPIIFMASRSLGAVFLVPGSLLAITSGVLFGPVWGAAYNLLSAVVGATLAFLVARYLAEDWVVRRTRGWLKKLVEGVEAEGWRFVAFVRLVPLFPYNVLNYALGLTRIKLGHFVVASAIFMVPGDVAYTYLGYAMREAMSGQESSIHIGLIALGLIATVAFLPRLVRRLRGNPAKNSAAV